LLLLLAARRSSATEAPRGRFGLQVQIAENEYGLKVIEDKDLYLQTIAEATGYEDLSEEPHATAFSCAW
jgi:hypothetical protein